MAAKAAVCAPVRLRGHQEHLERRMVVQVAAHARQIDHRGRCPASRGRPPARYRCAGGSRAIRRSRPPARPCRPAHRAVRPARCTDPDGPAAVQEHAVDERVGRGPAAARRDGPRRGRRTRCSTGPRPASSTARRTRTDGCRGSRGGPRAAGRTAVARRDERGVERGEFVVGEPTDPHPPRRVREPREERPRRTSPAAPSRRSRRGDPSSRCSRCGPSSRRSRARARTRGRRRPTGIPNHGMSGWWPRPSARAGQAPSANAP